MRIYQNKYLSVTSIVGLREPFDNSSFINWCEKNGKDHALVSSTSRILGGKVSEYLDNTYRGLKVLFSPPTDLLEENLYLAIEDFLKEWEVIETERLVICEQWNYAGRFDGIIENKETKEKLLVDWKTFGAWKEAKYKRDSSKIRHTRWQLSLYNRAILWEEGMAVVIFKNDGTWEIERVKLDQEMLDWVRDNQELILSVIQNEKGRCNCG
jgi:hypothetical protein